MLVPVVPATLVIATPTMLGAARRSRVTRVPVPVVAVTPLRTCAATPITLITVVVTAARILTLCGHATGEGFVQLLLGRRPPLILGLPEFSQEGLRLLAVLLKSPAVSLELATSNLLHGGGLRQVRCRHPFTLGS